MRAINHFTIKAMETVSISDKLKIEHEVAKVSQQAGLNPSKVEIGKSVSEVIHFLKRAKRYGDRECGATSSPRIVSDTKGTVPVYFKKVEEFAADSEDDAALIVELVNVGIKFQAFKKETTGLVLTSADLNSKDFSLVLAEVLLQPKSLIYVETQCLTSKGIKRLRALLEDIKRMFDNRVWIILLTQKDSSGQFADVIEKEFNLFNIKTKRSHEEDQKDCEDKKKFIISKDQTCKTGHDVVKISNLEKQIVDLKNLVESEKLEHVKTNSMSMQNASDLEGKLQALEEVNLTLIQDVEGWKVKAEDYYNERQCLRQENDKFSLEIEEGKKRLGVLQEKIEKSDKDCHSLRAESDRLLKSIVVFKEESEKNNNLNARLEDCEKKRLSLGQKNYKLTQEMNVCKIETEKFRDLEINRQYLLKDLGERDHEIKQIHDELVTSKGVIDELRELHQGHLEKNKLLQENKICQPSKSENSCQTKLVTVSDSLLSSIVGKIDVFKVKFPNAGASELLYRSIKNLKCNLSFIRSEDKVQCSIEIDSGKGIIEHKDLLVTVSAAVLDDNLA